MNHIYTAIIVDQVNHTHHPITLTPTFDRPFAIADITWPGTTSAKNHALRFQL